MAAYNCRVYGSNNNLDDMLMNRICCWRPIVAIVLLILSGRDALRADEPAKAASDDLLSVLDANPLFLDKMELPVRGDQLEKVAKASEAGTARKGAAADGVSLLLLRAEFAAAGVVEFSLRGEEPFGKLVLATDLSSRASSVATIPLGTDRHVALAIYLPPAEFGEENAGEGAFSRQVAVTAKFWRGKPASERGPPDSTKVVSVEIVRPPVVLVHGLYHDPEIAWQTPPPADIGTETMEQALSRRGFKVFLVDYAETNGKSGAGPSRLQDNQQVVWSNKGGIRDALESFREIGYAATQADVVGHSMGGLLTRAYIKGERLEAGGRRLEEEKKRRETGGWRPEEEKKEKYVGDETRGARLLPRAIILPPAFFLQPPASSLQSPASGLQPSSWYLRPDNFQQGDVHRLITLCTPHQGSELVRLLLRFEESARKFDPSDDFNPEFLLRLFDLAYGVSTGAFTDQDLFSPAIAALGETRVRVHAIGCTVDEEDFADFDGVYRWNFLTMLLLTPPDLLKGLFEHPDIRRGDDAVKLLAFAAEHVSLRSGIVAKALAALTGRPLGDKSSEERHRLYNSGAALFAAAVFAGQAHDGAVAEPSAHGGLKPPFASTLPHTLHSFAPRYPATQQKVLELLEGPGSNFAESLPAPESLWAKPEVEAKE